MERHWLLTTTCYGNWLPGDDRGFIGRVREHRADDPTVASRVEHDLPGTPYDEEMPGLKRASEFLLKCPPIVLEQKHARVVLAQFLETARVRSWSLLAVSIMFNHFHIVVGVTGDPPPSKILGDLKSWGTRSLTKHFGEPPSKTWWTERGSKRKLPDEVAVVRAIQYVLLKQPSPLVTWSPETDRNLVQASVEA